MRNLSHSLSKGNSCCAPQGSQQGTECLHCYAEGMNALFTKLSQRTQRGSHPYSANQQRDHRASQEWRPLKRGSLTAFIFRPASKEAHREPYTQIFCSGSPEELRHQTRGQEQHPKTYKLSLTSKALQSGGLNTMTLIKRGGLAHSTLRSVAKEAPIEANDLTYYLTTQSRSRSRCLSMTALK